jgi:soluble lytic murein transglycosylase-like protein
MYKTICAFFFLVLVVAPAIAQERPMSPPARPPIPLTDSDQARARVEALNREKTVPTGEKTPTSTQIRIPMTMVGHHISSGNPALDTLVRSAAARNGLDPCLILSVMRAESGFNRSAVSVKGASGLMQLMPETAARFGVRNIFDPEENVMAGARYLRFLLDRFRGDVRLALAGYNAGEGAVELYGLRIPPFQETQNYVRTIYTRYSGIHLGPAPAATPAPTATVAATVGDSKDKNPTYNQVIKLTSSNGGGAGR